MTRLDALRELRDRVRDGTFDVPPGGAHSPYFNRFMETAEDALPQDVMAVSTLAWRAYSGSVDAAISFVEAVLPDFEVSFTSGNGRFVASVWRLRNTATDHIEVSDTPARALLLAALEALIEQESG